MPSAAPTPSSKLQWKSESAKTASGSATSRKFTTLANTNSPRNPLRISSSSAKSRNPSTKDGKPKVVGERIQYVADPVRLLVARSLFTSRGFSYLDQVFGGDLNGLAQALRLTTGVKPQQIDLESQKFFQERDKKRALEDVLIRGGVIKSYQNNYVPKDK
jgi:hypothetical protein